MIDPRKFTSTIAPILILGVVVRELLAPFTGHPFDLELWIRIGYYMSKGINPYSATAPVAGLSFPGATYMTWIGYPPTWAFFQVTLYKLYETIGINSRFFYYSLIKQPMIIGDMLSGYIVYRIIESYVGAKSARHAFAFWMFCPVIILVSSVWGMFDQIILVLVLSSIMFSTETKKSAFVQSLGFLLKVIPLIYVPLLAFVQKSRRLIAEYLLLWFTTSFAFALVPFLFFKSWKISQLIGVGVDISHKLGNSMNYWMILAAYANYFQMSNFQTTIFQAISLTWIPALIIATYFCVRTIRQSINMQQGLYLSALFITLTFFLTKSIINEQYSIYFLALGLVDYYVVGNAGRKRLFHSVWISVAAFLFVNNTYLIRFLTPISSYYRSMDIFLASGSAGEVRTAILVTISIFFSVFCAMYLRSLYTEIRSLARPRLATVKSATD